MRPWGAPKSALPRLFAKEPRWRLEVWWQNAKRTGTYLIDIAGKSIWTTPKGLRLDLGLEQLQKLKSQALQANRL